MTTIKLSDLLDAFDFASFGHASEAEAYVNLRTGSLICIDHSDDADEAIPDDIDSPERYLALPHRNDLDLGQPLIREFVELALPSDYEILLQYFRQRGTYRRFKDLLEDRGVLDAWFAFERQATEEALKKWCEDNGIELSFPDESGHSPR